MSATPSTGTELLHLVRLAAETPVHTLKGTIPAGDLQEGDRLIARSGAVRLARVRREVLSDIDMVRVGASTMAHNRPEAPQIMPAEQPLLLRGERADMVYGSIPAKVPAGRIADGKLTRIERMKELRVVTLGFSAPAAIYAGDLQPVTRPEEVPVEA
ncbi:Hint domain-containing protein [Rhodobacter sp. NSM]|uniref:Hint domain-containing protein n=1 Tax=Rhodobacter sp. NSM TaxID=3457501 RepID=UPI003FD40DA7